MAARVGREAATMTRDQGSGDRSQESGDGGRPSSVVRRPSLIGTSPQRIEGREKVTGAATYVDDMQFGPNLLHGALKRSPIAHGV